MLTSCYSALRTSFETDAHGLVEHVKSFIESVCLTIMGELREPIPTSSPSTTDLLVAALNPLGLRNTRGASKLDKVLSGFNKLADALSEMRNINGPIAHGKDAFLDTLTADHARAFLHTGDAILGVLLHRLDGRQPDLTVTREPYESFPHLNEKIDRSVRVDVRVDEDADRSIVVFSVATGPREEAFELRVEPSRLLYGIDRSAYIEVLKTADLALGETESDEAERHTYPTTEEDTSIPAKLEATPVAAPVAEIVPAYGGHLETLRQSLAGFLMAHDIDPSHPSERGEQLTDSLLASAEHNMGIDWKQRESVQARLKVAFKRVLVQFQVPLVKADQVAEHLVAWLIVQAPDINSSLGELPAASGESGP
ncbi:MAG: abortive infection family protein [Cyanobium sp.]